MRAVAPLADPQDVLLERAALDVRGRIQEVGQVHLGPRLDDARACVAAVGQRLDERAARRMGVDRRDDLSGRARERTGALVARLTEMSLPITATLSGELARRG